MGRRGRSRLPGADAFRAARRSDPGGDGTSQEPGAPAGHFPTGIAREPVTDALVEHGDSQVLLSVAGNAGARFSGEGLGRLIERARGDDSLAERVGRRKDIPPLAFALLIQTASERVRVKLQAELPHAAYQIRESWRTAHHVARKHESEPRDVDAIHASIERLHSQGQLDDEQLRSFAEDGLLEEIRLGLSLIRPAIAVDRSGAEAGERRDAAGDRPGDRPCLEHGRANPAASDLAASGNRK